jgi:hypothetical protein
MTRMPYLQSTGEYTETGTAGGRKIARSWTMAMEGVIEPAGDEQGLIRQTQNNKAKANDVIRSHRPI